MSKLIPFGIMPAAWGLKGKSRTRAKAEYELEGYELEVALANIDLGGDVLKAELVAIDYSHSKITMKEHDYAIAELRGSEEDTLKVQLKHNDLSKREYDKAFATLKNEPWVDIPSVHFDGDNPGGGSMELDWNDAFIAMLEEAGYIAPKEEDTVDLWFTDLCKNIALEELSGTGVFDDEAEEAMEVKRKRLDNGNTEVS